MDAKSIMHHEAENIHPDFFCDSLLSAHKTKDKIHLKLACWTYLQYTTDILEFALVQAYIQLWQ